MRGCSCAMGEERCHSRLGNPLSCDRSTLPKPLFPLVLDATPLPASLADLPTLSGQLPVASTLTALLTLPEFPPARSSDPLHVLYEEATHDLIRVRRAAIEKAAALLAQDQHRDALLTLLTYISEHDQTTMLQKEASKALLANAQKYTPAPPFSTIESSLMIRGHCEQGRLSYYNKRLICQQYRDIAYAPLASQHRQDELLVPCQAKGSSLKVVVRVDCGAYR